MQQVVDSFFIKIEGGSPDGVIRNETTIGPFDKYEIAMKAGDDFLLTRDDADGYQIEKYRAKVDVPDDKTQILIAK